MEELAGNPTASAEAPSARAGKFIFSALLGRILGGERLRAGESELLLEEILDGGGDPIVVGAILVAMRARGETPEELVGFARAMRSRMLRVPVAGAVTDTCGTGGDRLGTINVSTGAALVVAACGVDVCKHGGRAASSKAGSADVLEELGVRIDSGPEGVARSIAATRFGFAFAPLFHPAMARVAPIRRALGVPTAFNFLGPLINPAGALTQLVGVFDAGYHRAMAGVLAALGSSRALVVTGYDGLDEVSISGPTRALEMTSDGDSVEYRELVINPEEYGIGLAGLDEVAGGDGAANAGMLVEIVSGVDRGPRSDLVAINAGATLWVAGAAANLGDGIEMARESLRSGAPALVLESLKSLPA